MSANAPVMLANAASRAIGLSELTPGLYRDLRRIASRHLSGERSNHTLQATALVHEAYLKLAKERAPSFVDDAHLLAIASRAMRQILVDHARSRGTQKRQGQMKQVDFPDTIQIAADSGPEPVDVLALDDALTALAREDEQLARIIEMRYFGGMTAEESARALSISVHALRHQLRFAQAWLQRRLRTGN